MRYAPALRRSTMPTIPATRSSPAGFVWATAADVGAFRPADADGPGRPVAGRPRGTPGDPRPARGAVRAGAILPDPLDEDARAEARAALQSVEADLRRVHA